MRTEQRSFRGDDPDDVKQLLQQTTAGTEAPEVDDILDQLDQAVEELKDEELEGSLTSKMDALDIATALATGMFPKDVVREVKKKEAEGYVYQCHCGVGRYLCPEGKWVKK